MPGCSRKHIFHPHNIYSSAGLYRFKVVKPKTLSHGEPAYRDIHTDPPLSARRGKNKISLIVETLPYWMVASPLNHHHAPLSVKIFPKLRSQRPISPTPSVANTLLYSSFFNYVVFFLWRRSAVDRERVGNFYVTTWLPADKNVRACKSVCDVKFPCARGACTDHCSLHCQARRTWRPAFCRDQLSQNGLRSMTSRTHVLHTQ